MKTGKSLPTSLLSVSEYRIQARRLLNQLRSDSVEAATAAAERFRRLRSFSTATTKQILDARDGLRLKQALALIALENGHESWRALKQSAEASSSSSSSSSSRAPQTSQPGREMYCRALDVLLNRWFASYEEARASLDQQGGFLLPFERQFFVCEEEGIRVLGLDPEDPDWERIGRDWVKPLDQEAWLRLRMKREQFLLSL
ncbi:MAG TPA: hypothetical protein VGX92_15125 [Pyrinomonadaceae bacterium]|jgi:hypothetical protein|nr:hypothetical protein [Pyrinomonadaceae bacterium]